MMTMMTRLRLGAGHNINNQTPRAIIRDMVLFHRYEAEVAAS